MLADIVSHARNKALDKQSSVAPLALEAIKRIDSIFDSERESNGFPAEERLSVRKARVAPLMRSERARLSRHAEAAKVTDYMLKR